MKKLLRIITAIIGLGVVASVIGAVLIAPRYLDDIELRCQVNLQFAKLTSIIFKPLDEKTKIDRIQMSKDACESEKKRDEFFKELDETLEYFF